MNEAKPIDFTPVDVYSWRVRGSNPQSLLTILNMAVAYQLPISPKSSRRVIEDCMYKHALVKKPDFTLQTLESWSKYGKTYVGIDALREIAMSYGLIPFNEDDKGIINFSSKKRRPEILEELKLIACQQSLNVIINGAPPIDIPGKRHRILCILPQCDRTIVFGDHTYNTCHGCSAIYCDFHETMLYRFVDVSCASHCFLCIVEKIKNRELRHLSITFDMLYDIAQRYYEINGAPLL